MSVDPPRDPRDKIVQEYRKKVQEHQEYEARLKQGKSVLPLRVMHGFHVKLSGNVAAYSSRGP